MLTNKERELVEYWLNYKPGKKEFVPNKLEEPIVVEVKLEEPRLDYLAEDIVEGIWDII